MSRVDRRRLTSSGCGTIPASSSVDPRAQPLVGFDRQHSVPLRGPARSLGLVFSITALSRCSPRSSLVTEVRQPAAGPGLASACAAPSVSGWLKRLICIDDLRRGSGTSPGLKSGGLRLRYTVPIVVALHDLFGLARRHLQRDQARRLVLRQRGRAWRRRSSPTCGRARSTGGRTVDEPTANTFRPGSRNAVVVQAGAVRARRRPSRSRVQSTLTVSPGVTKPPTAWVWSRLTVIACLPFGMAPATVLTSCDDCTNWSRHEGRAR